MNKLFTRLKSVLTIIILVFSLPGITQTNLYTETFNGNSNTFTLNSSDLGGVSASNYWVVNDVYPGGNITGECFGLPIVQPVPNTPDEPGGIIGGPQSKNLHITSFLGLTSGGIQNSHYVFPIVPCFEAGGIFAKMSNGVSTVADPNISFSFWWLCGGGTENYGEVYYSTDGGIVWNLVPGAPDFFDSPAWQLTTLTDPAFGNQADLRFAFRFVNTGVNEVLLSFAIDDISIDTEEPGTNSITTGALLPGPYCPGQQIQIPFSATGIYTAGNVFTGQLSNAGGSFASPTDIGTLSGTGNGVISATIPLGTPAGTYQIRVVSNQPAVTGTPSVVSVTVEGPPLASIDPGSPTTACANSNVTLTYNGTTNGDIQWYSSIDGANFFPIFGETGLTLTDGPLTVPTFYQAEIIGACGNSVSAPWFVDIGGTSAAITLNVPPSLNLCNGGIPVSLNGTYTNIQWSTGETNVVGITVTTPGSISVTGTDPSGCQASSAIINIIETVPAELVVTPNPATLCGSPVTINATSGFDQYIWSNGQSSPSIVISELPAVPLTVSGIDNNGCVVAPISVQVTQGTAVTLPVTPTVATVCDGEPATLSAESGFTDYVWSNGASGQSISVSLTGYYSVTAIDASGCEATSPLIEVVQAQFPIPNFTYSQNAGGYTITFDNTSQNGTEYVWYFDSLSTSPLENPAFTFPDNGPYLVTLIITNPCGTDTITKLVLVAQVGIQDLMAQHNVNVYPNPSSGDFNVVINNDAIDEFYLDVFDVSGRIVYSASQKFSGNKLLTIPARDFNPGMYFLRIHKDSIQGVLKLVKE